MTQLTQTPSLLTIGLDVGDRTTHLCVLDGERQVAWRGRCETRREALQEALAPYPGSRVILEAGSQSHWMAAALQAWGCLPHVVDPRRVALIAKDPRKCDRRDAESLARLGLGCPELLGRVHHRDEATQADLSLVRTRDLLVRTRTRVIQQVRGLCKVFGVRLPSCSAEAFGRRMGAQIPELLAPAVEPLLGLLADLHVRLEASDRRLKELAQTRYREATERVAQPHGVGPVTSVAFVLTLADPARFAHSRDVGSWVGLCPRNSASGDRAPQLGISKCGDGYLRRLLVQDAHYILGHFGKDSDLRRFGLRLVARGGAGAKQRAAVAVARKLAVLLHRLWVSGQPYEPLHQASLQTALASA